MGPDSVLRIRTLKHLVSLPLNKRWSDGKAESIKEVANGLGAWLQFLPPLPHLRAYSQGLTRSCRVVSSPQCGRALDPASQGSRRCC